jgi:hypothetical protein
MMRDLVGLKVETMRCANSQKESDTWNTKNVLDTKPTING